MFDFNAILAALGGSLGLFLGFSCWDTAIYVIGIIYHLKK